MKIEIPFNKDVFKRQMLLNFDLYVKPNLKKNRRRLIWIALFLVSGGYVLSTGDKNGVLFLFGGFVFLLNFINYEWFYWKKKKHYLMSLAKVSNEFEKENANAIWEFTDEYLGYIDHRFETKIKWTAFSTYRIIEDNLFFNGDTISGNTFIIGREEVGEQLWVDIINLVSNKLKIIS
nr:hypothetical protein [uncultured Carboxylicivirga sp.]